MDKNKDWVCVYKATKRFDAEAVRGNLEHAGITAVLFNRQDSSYLAFGYVEVHVPATQEAAAIAVIEGKNEPESTD